MGVGAGRRSGKWSAFARLAVIFDFALAAGYSGTSRLFSFCPFWSSPLEPQPGQPTAAWHCAPRQGALPPLPYRSGAETLAQPPAFLVSTYLHQPGAAQVFHVDEAARTAQSQSRRRIWDRVLSHCAAWAAGRLVSLCGWQPAPCSRALSTTSLTMQGKRGALARARTRPPNREGKSGTGPTGGSAHRAGSAVSLAACRLLFSARTSRVGQCGRAGGPAAGISKKAHRRISSSPARATKKLAPGRNPTRRTWVAVRSVGAESSPTHLPHYCLHSG